MGYPSLIISLLVLSCLFFSKAKQYQSVHHIFSNDFSHRFLGMESHSHHRKKGNILKNNDLYLKIRNTLSQSNINILKYKNLYFERVSQYFEIPSAFF